MIEFACSGCGHILKSSDSTAGRRAKCRKCGAVVTIPAPEVPDEEMPDLSALAKLSVDAPAAPAPIFTSPAKSRYKPPRPGFWINRKVLILVGGGVAAAGVLVALALAINAALHQTPNKRHVDVAADDSPSTPFSLTRTQESVPTGPTVHGQGERPKRSFSPTTRSSSPSVHATTKSREVSPATAPIIDPVPFTTDHAAELHAQGHDAEAITCLEGCIAALPPKDKLIMWQIPCHGSAGLARFGTNHAYIPVRIERQPGGPPVGNGSGAYNYACVNADSGEELWRSDVSGDRCFVDPVNDDFFCHYNRQVVRLDAQSGDVTLQEQIISPDPKHEVVWNGVVHSGLIDAHAVGSFDRLLRAYDVDKKAMVQFPYELLTGMKGDLVLQVLPQDDGVLAMAREDKRQLVVEPSGWKFVHPGAARLYHKISDKGIFVWFSELRCKAEIMRLDPKTGQPQWTVSIPTGINGATERDGRMIVQDEFGLIFSYDAANGHLLGTVAPPALATRRGMPPVVADDGQFSMPQLSGRRLWVRLFDTICCMSMDVIEGKSSAQRDLQMRIVHLYQSMGNLPKAIDALDKIIEAMPNDQKAWELKLQLSALANKEQDEMLSRLRLMKITNATDSPELNERYGLIRRIPTPRIEARPVVIGKDVYVGDLNGNVMVIDAHTLAVKNLPTLPDAISRFALDGDKLKTEGTNMTEHTVRMFNRKMENPEYPPKRGNDGTRPVEAGGGVFSWGREIKWQKNGRTEWIFQISGTPHQQPRIIQNGVAMRNRRAPATNMRNTFEPLPMVSILDMGNDSRFTEFFHAGVVASGKLFVGADEGGLYIFDLAKITGGAVPADTSAIVSTGSGHPAHGPATRPVVEAAPTDAPTVVEQTTIALPAKIEDVAIGGAGRFYVFSFRSNKQIAIFDAVKKQITKTLEMPSENFRCAAGMTKFVVVDQDAGTIGRYDLASGTMEKTAPIPGHDRMDHVLMGEASEGPVLLISGPMTTGPVLRRNVLLDLQSFTRLVQPKNPQTTGAPPKAAYMNIQPGQEIDPDNFWIGHDMVFEVWATPDGSIFSGVLERAYSHSDYQPWGTLSWNGVEFKPEIISGDQPNGPMVRHHIRSHDARLAANLEKLDENAMVPAYPWPGPSEELFLAVGALKNNEGLDISPDAGLYSICDGRKLVGFHELEELKGVQDFVETESSRFRVFATKSLAYRLRILPEAGALILLSADNEHVVMRPFDLAAALKDAGDYLYVDRTPPLTAMRGKPFHLKLAIHSKAGGINCTPPPRNRRGSKPPEGLEITPQGDVTWNVPMDFDQKVVTIPIQIDDAAHDRITHPILITVK